MEQNSVNHMTPNSTNHLDDTNDAGDFMSFREFVLAMSVAEDGGGPIPVQIDEDFLTEFAYDDWEPRCWKDVETNVRKCAPHLIEAAKNCWDMFESESDFEFIWMLIAYLNVDRLESEIETIYASLMEFTKRLPAEVYTSMPETLLTQLRKREKWKDKTDT